MDAYDWRQVAWDIFLVVSVAAITAVLDVLPNIAADQPLLVLGLPVIAATLSAVRRYLMDSRHYQVQKLEELEKPDAARNP